MIKEYKIAEEQLDVLDRSHSEESLTCFGGGGKGGSPTPVYTAPTPAIEEASVEITDEEKKKKLQTGKSELKVPLSTSADTGLKV